jgi:hypothetical protein
MAVQARTPTRNWGTWILQGGIGGIVAGIIFAMFEMAWGYLQGGFDMGVAPLRMIGGIALGPQALEPSYSLIIAAVAGIVVHMVLSMMYGGAFALGVGLVAPRTGTGPIVVAAIVVGLALWVVNFFVIGPVAGWKWFADMTDPTIQAIAHGGFFGIPLGLYVARFRPQATMPTVPAQ